MCLHNIHKILWSGVKLTCNWCFPRYLSSLCISLRSDAMMTTVDHAPHCASIGIGFLDAVFTGSMSHSSFKAYQIPLSGFGRPRTDCAYGIAASAQSFLRKQTNQTVPRTRLDHSYSQLDLVMGSFQDEILIPQPRNTGLPQFQPAVFAVCAFF